LYTTTATTHNPAELETRWDTIRSDHQQRKATIDNLVKTFDRTSARRAGVELRLTKEENARRATSPSSSSLAAAGQTVEELRATVTTMEQSIRADRASVAETERDTSSLKRQLQAMDEHSSDLRSALAKKKRNNLKAVSDGADVQSGPAAVEELAQAREELAAARESLEEFESEASHFEQGKSDAFKNCGELQVSSTD